VIQALSQVVVEVEDRDRAVRFWTEIMVAQPPAQESWGWWSMSQDQESNRFALHPREAT
jgi:hypothetical protein